MPLEVRAGGVTFRVETGEEKVIQVQTPNGKERIYLKGTDAGGTITTISTSLPLNGRVELQRNSELELGDVIFFAFAE